MLLPEDGLVAAPASLGHMKQVHWQICDYTALHDEAFAVELV